MLVVGPLVDSASWACQVGQPVQRRTITRTSSSKKTGARACCAPRASSLCSTLCAQLVWKRSQHARPFVSLLSWLPAETCAGADGGKRAAEALVDDGLRAIDRHA